jgi:lipid II:glycine glycyltransferase (peptidoglycan interpeptide bridge formation enzyme)
MKIIQFKENQKTIWNKFIAENNSESFLQAWEWGEFQSKIERKIWRIGIIEDDLFNENETSKSKIQNHKFQINSIPQCDAGQNSKLIAMALIVKYDLPFGRSYLYCSRGPVVSEIANCKLRI